MEYRYSTHGNQFSFEHWEDAGRVENHDCEYTKISVGSYTSGVEISVQTSYTYESGRTSTHHTSISMTPDECRELARELNWIADHAEGRRAAV